MYGGIGFVFDVICVGFSLCCCLCYCCNWLYAMFVAAVPVAFAALLPAK